MKIELLDVVFDNPRSVHYAGDRITGKVLIQLRSSIEVQGVNIDFRGKAKCDWMKSADDSEKKYRAEEIYLGKRVQITDSPSGGTTELVAGCHKYTFSLMLPPTLPSSFEGKKGYVRYFCKVTIERPRKFGKSTKRPFTVIHHLDLNNVRNAAVPVVGEQELLTETLCCTMGWVTGKLTLNKAGYVPGEALIYNIDVWNRSNSTIVRFELILKQYVTYTGYSDSIFSNGNPKQHTKVEEFPMLNFPCRIKHGTEEHLNQGAIIPALPPSGLEGCGIIDINYIVVLKIYVSWTSVSIEQQITIGTIPLRQEGEPVLRRSRLMEEPPPYQEPPPSYEESVMGCVTLVDDEDDAHDAAWAPSYPYYYAISARSVDASPPITTQPGATSLPAYQPPPPAYSQIK